MITIRDVATKSGFSVTTVSMVLNNGPGGDRMRKDASGTGTKYIYFNGSVIAEKDVTTGNWSDYIFAGGKRIARATNSIASRTVELSEPR